MKNFVPKWIVGTNQQGDFVAIPIQVGVKPEMKGVSGIVAQPSAEQDRIAKERAKDYSLKGVLKKQKDDKG